MKLISHVQLVICRSFNHDITGTSYDSILVIFVRLTKIIHYKPAQMIDPPGLAEVLIDLIARYGSPRPPRLNYQ